MVELVYNDHNIEAITLEGIPWIRQDDGTYKCKYLNWRKKCSIWNKKPFICKKWFCNDFKDNCKNCKHNCCENMMLLWNNRLTAGVTGNMKKLVKR